MDGIKKFEMYNKAKMEYRAADSTIISIAIRDRRLAPGIHDTFRNWMTIPTVDSTVVAIDSEYEPTNTEL
jgi:hypothetical protein